MRASKARAGLRAGQTRHKRWNAYGKHLPSGPEVGAVCGKAACTDLCGGCEVTRIPTATGGSSLRSWPVRQHGPLWSARSSPVGCRKGCRVFQAKLARSAGARVRDGEAPIGPGMKDTRLWEPVTLLAAGCFGSGEFRSIRSLRGTEVSGSAFFVDLTFLRPHRIRQCRPDFSCANSHRSSRSSFQ
jgi:hypothetical protein